MAIKEIQIALDQYGIDPGPIDGIAGPKTYAAVKAFQRDIGDIETGIIDWNFLNQLFPEYIWSDDLALRALEIMEMQVGVREQTGKNDGLQVEAYLRAVGLEKGQSYCMAIIVWCYDQAAKSLKVAMPLARTGGVLDQVNKSYRYKTPSGHIPQPGDIGYIDLMKGRGHAFIVRQYAAGVVNTVEGNTNDDGSANGDGDYFRQRRVSSITGFLRVKL
jgi:hypothetical protein